MDGYGIETYADLAKTVGGMVLANEMGHRPLELVSGDIAPWDEIFQWYIISYPDFLMEHTDEPVFHDEEAPSGGDSAPLVSSHRDNARSSWRS